MLAKLLGTPVKTPPAAGDNHDVAGRLVLGPANSG
jgi:hypothetical protein